jgi:tetratricopeptide (TPR) repeat protein
MAEVQRTADELAKTFPADAAALDVRAKLNFGLGHRKEAMELWRQCAQLDPENASPYLSAMGIVAANSGAPDEAAALFREAIEKGSQDPQTPVLLAENLMKASRLDEAVAVLEHHLQSRSVSQDALTKLGQVYLELDQCEKALSAFQSAIQASPQNKAAHYGLARALARLGDKSRSASAMEEFRKLESLDASQTLEEFKTFNDDSSTREMALEAFIAAARCYRARDRISMSEKLLQNAAAIAPADVESRSELVALYERTGRHQAALEVCKQLRTIDPKKGDYWMNEGVLSARLGELDQGLAALRRALQIDPSNRQYRQTHDLILQETKR